MSKLALVTVLYNSDDVLEGFFKSISIQTFKDYHLYLIDNTPSVTTDKLIAEFAEQYCVENYTHIKNSENLGVAKGNNQGIELSLAQGSLYTLLLNNDIEFNRVDLFEFMLAHALNNNETLLFPKILYYDTRKIWMAGGIMQPYKGTNIHVGDGLEDGPDFNESKYFDYAPTCFMLVDNKVFRQIGQMNEKYFVYYDDVDFIYRATSAGHKVCYLPDLTILHKVSSSTGGVESLFSIYYSNRNRIYFLRENYSGLKFIIPIIFTLSTRIIKYLTYEQKKRGALLKAVVDGLKM